jgi:LEA14-like dessication related protein
MTASIKRLQSSFPLWPLTGLVYVFLILSCCAGCGKIFEQPGVRIQSVHIKKIKNMEALFRVDIEVSNPNFASFEIQSIECDIEMDGRRIASAVSEEKTLIPSRGTGIVPLEVHSTSFDIISVLLKRLKSKLNDNRELDYKITGKIYLNSLFYSPPPVVFSSTGNLFEKIGGSKQQ